jgi:hypothetical protein
VFVTPGPYAGAMTITELAAYAAAAVFGALSTYVFARSIEARRVAFQRHLEAERSSVLALRRWREGLAREWLLRQSRRWPSSWTSRDELPGLAAEILRASESMPRWKADLVRKGLVALTGDTALLAHWIGPLREAQATNDDDTWFSAFLELGNHFDELTVSALSDRAERFARYTDEAWTEVWGEAAFLERALGSRWWQRPALRVDMTAAESDALKSFGYLSDWRRSRQVVRLVPHGVAPGD